MKAAPRVLVHGEVARPADISVAVHQHAVEGDEPERAIDVENRSELRHELLPRCLLEEPRETHQVSPGGGIFRGLELIGAPIARDVVPVVRQPLSAATLGDFPAHSLARAERLTEEVLVELLDVDVDAPALAVDDELDQVRPRRRQVLPGDVIVKDVPQERGVGVRVEEVEGLVAVEVAAVLAVIDRQVQRPLLAGADAEEGGVAAEPHAHLRVLLPVDDEVRRHVDVGAIEVGHLLFPVLLEEHEKERAEDPRVIERSIGIGLHVALGDALRLARRILLLGRGASTATETAAETAAETATPRTEAGAVLPLLLDVLPGPGALAVVEPAVAVVVELLDEAHRLPSRTAAAGTEAPSAEAPPAEAPPAGRSAAATLGQEVAKSAKLLVIEVAVAVPVEPLAELLGREALPRFTFATWAVWIVRPGALVATGLSRGLAGDGQAEETEPGGADDRHSHFVLVPSRWIHS